MQKFSQDFFSENVPKWKMLLSHLSGRENLRFLEIGCYEGRSSTFLLENVLTSETSKITCVDPFTGRWENANLGTGSLHETFLHNVQHWKDKVELFKDSSNDVLPRLIVEGRRYDFIYVDGSHTSCDVLFDAVNSFKILNVGGIMAFDDYLGGNPNSHNDPKPGVDSFLFTYQDKIRILLSDYQMWVQKIAD